LEAALILKEIEVKIDVNVLQNYPENVVRLRATFILKANFGGSRAHEGLRVADKARFPPFLPPLSIAPPCCENSGTVNRLFFTNPRH
jgi:hypothetical protein